MHHCLRQLEKAMKTQHSQKEKNVETKTKTCKQKGGGGGGAAEKGVEKSFGKRDQGLGRAWRPAGAEGKPAWLERHRPIGTECQPHVQLTIF